MLEFIPDESLWWPAMIFCARICDVSLGTIRVIAVTRGHGRAAFVLALAENVIWVTAISSVFTHLDNWLNILAWSAGFATGNAVGMAIERRLAMGLQIITFISQGRFDAVAERLRFNDLRVTTYDGRGRSGPIASCVTVVPRKMADAVIQMARDIDPEVGVTVEDVRESTMAQPNIRLSGKSPLRVPFLRLAWFKGPRPALRYGPVVE